MSGIVLNLVVLRTTDLDRAARFYAVLGLEPVLEQHGAGPEHLSARSGGVQLEIYPLGRSAGTVGVRLGFGVVDLEATLAAALSAGGQVFSEPQDGPWGLRAVILDPDGHRIELVQD